LDWKGWSEGGKKGLLELLEMIVKLRAKEKSFKASQANKKRGINWLAAPSDHHIFTL